MKPKLAGLKEAAALLGKQKSNFARDWRKWKGFPKPLDVLSCGPIWLLADLHGWLEDRRRGWLDGE